MTSILKRLKAKRKSISSNDNEEWENLIYKKNISVEDLIAYKACLRS